MSTPAGAAPACWNCAADLSREHAHACGTERLIPRGLAGAAGAVLVECAACGEWNELACGAPAAGAGGHPPRGRVAELQELRGLLAAGPALQRQESHAQWLFGGAGGVAALSSLFATVVAGSLDPWGTWACAAGIALLAVSLALATLTLAPVWLRFNPNDVEAMHGVLAAQFASRRRNSVAAAWLLAAALALFGISPLVGKLRAVRPDPQVLVSYTLRPNGTLEAALTARGLAAFAPISLTLDGAGAPVARTVGQADSTGQGRITLEGELAAGSYVLTGRGALARAPGGVKESRARIHVPPRGR
ncbi:MAG TPA: hypothetical protein VGB92_18175 [Longimicrobium sp.]|jgi:hypothetical protein